MTEFSANAPAKINLYLNVTGKNDDGYHSLDSLVAFADYGDTITVQDSDDISLDISGEFANQLDKNASNIVVDTAILMQNLTPSKSGVYITLEKNIPIGGGLGGGSSDAATVAKLLRILWDIDMSDDDLASYLLPLGADIPVCVYATASHVSGIGEDINQLSFSRNIPVLLVNPRIFLSTGDVFKAGFNKFSDDTSINDIPVDFENLVLWLKNKNNDLEKNAISKVHEISAVLDSIANLENCRLARMSGSGATCFGIFNKLEQASQAKDILADTHPDWCIIATELH